MPEEEVLRSTAAAVSAGLAERALQLSQDGTYFSPFAQNAKKHGLNFTGGKQDDITVVVAFVSSSSSTTA